MSDPAHDDLQAQLRRRAQHSGLRGTMMETELLRVFVAVVEFGSFTAAARSLDRTQAAVSTQIRRLEEAVGSELFSRQHRSLHLTDSGQTLLSYARQILDLHSQALIAMRPAVLSGRIRISANDHYATVILPPLIARFCVLHPEVLVEVSTGISSISRPRLGIDYDLLISLRDSNMKREDNCIRLTRESVVWATSRKNSPHARKPLPIALGVPGSLFRGWAIAALQRTGRPWHQAFQSSNVAVLEAAVAEGLAVGIFKRQTIGNRLRVLTEAEGFEPLPDIDIVLEKPEGPLPAQVLAFHETLVAWAADQMQMHIQHA